MPPFGIPEEDNVPVPVPAPASDPKQVLEQTPVEPVVVEQGNYDSVIRDGHYHNLRDYFHHMDGLTYTTQFYHQLLGAADNPEAFDPEGTAHAHQYRRIRNLQMKLQGDLTFSKDPDSGVVTITGEANLFPGFTPNKHDVFIGDAGDGRQYLFTITETEELSARRDRANKISITVMSVLTEEVRTKLDSLVVDAQVFTKEFVSEYGYLSETKLPTLRRLMELMSSCWAYYYDAFYAPDQRTFILEDTDGTRHYDKWLSVFIKSFEPDLSIYVNRENKSYDVGDHNESINTLWDMLLAGNDTLAPVINKEFDRHRCVSVPVSLRRDSISFSQIDYFNYPVDENNTLLSEFRATRRALIAKRSAPIDYTPETPSETPEPTIAESMDNHKQVGVDYYYVLSGAFYQNVPTELSLLEKLVSDYLSGKELLPEHLVSEFDRLLKEPDDRTVYYHLPILLLLGRTIVASDYV